MSDSDTETSKGRSNTVKMLYGAFTVMTGIAALISSGFSIVAFARRKPLSNDIHKTTALLGGLLGAEVLGAKALDALEKESDKKQPASFVERVGRTQTSSSEISQGR